MLCLIKNGDEFVAVKLLQYVVCFEKNIFPVSQHLSCFLFFSFTDEKGVSSLFPIAFSKDTHHGKRDYLVKPPNYHLKMKKSVFYQPVVKIVRDQAL